MQIRTSKYYCRVLFGTVCRTTLQIFPLWAGSYVEGTGITSDMLTAVKLQRKIGDAASPHTASKFFQKRKLGITCLWFLTSYLWCLLMTCLHIRAHLESGIAHRRLSMICTLVAYDLLAFSKDSRVLLFPEKSTLLDSEALICDLQKQGCRQQATLVIYADHQPEFLQLLWVWGLTWLCQRWSTCDQPSACLKQ